MSFSTATGFSSQKMEALCELNSPMVFVQRDRLLTMAIFHTEWSGHTHYEDLTPSLYSGCMARQDQDNGMVHNAVFLHFPHSTILCRPTLPDAQIRFTALETHICSTMVLEWEDNAVVGRQSWSACSKAATPKNGLKWTFHRSAQCTLMHMCEYMMYNVRSSGTHE